MVNNDVINYTLIILYADDTVDMQYLRDQLLNVWQMPAEIVIADAIGGEDSYRNTVEYLREVIDMPMRYENISEKIYENLAQVKNEAYKLADGLILMLNAGDNIEYAFNRPLVITDEKAALLNFLKSDSDDFSGVLLPRETLDALCGFNDKLPCIEEYELLIRCCYYGMSEGVMYFTGSESPDYQEMYDVYAYLIARYSGLLRQEGLFDQIIMRRVTQAQYFGVQDYFAGLCESMIKKDIEYRSINEARLPILMYYDSKLCYGATQSIAQAFGHALQNNGQPVIFLSHFDGEVLSREYKAVISVQAPLFDIEYEGAPIALKIHCPMFNMIFDHPMQLCYMLSLPFENTYVLHQDELDVEYIKNNHPTVKDAFHFPLAGEAPLRIPKNKIYDLSFVCYYRDYRKSLLSLKGLGDEAAIGMALFKTLVENPDLTFEEAYDMVLEDKKIEADTKEFTTGLHRIRDAAMAATYFYRELIIQAIVDGGIPIHVFSNTWKDCPFASNPNLIIHDDISFEESLGIYADSKASLNIMTWHKGGMTERVANIMMSGALCITDETTYINEHFTDGEDMIIFKLEDVDGLVRRLKDLLGIKHEDAAQIARSGRIKASTLHNWDVRAKQFIGILDSVLNRND